MSDLVVQQTGKMERTPQKIGEEIRSLTYQAKCMTVYFGVEIGRRLVEAKQMLPHGAWGDWVKQETEFSQSTANRFMRVFEEYGEEQIGIFGAVENSSTLKNLSISNALRLLAVPKEEREEFAAEVDAEHISARDLEQLIRERDEARHTASEAEKRREQLEADIAALKDRQEKAAEAEEEARRELEEMRSELQALRDKPVEVAVQVDEEAVSKAAAEARAAAETEWKKKLEAAEKKLSNVSGEKKALEGKIRELQEKEKSAGAADKEETERLSGEVEALKKQLAMSDAKIVTFKAKLENMRDAFSGLEDALRQMDAEMRGKMSAAACAQLDIWKKALDGQA